MSASAFIWTETAIARLCEMVNNGHSFAEIAKDLGCSRNGAIGKAHRIRLNSNHVQAGTWKHDETMEMIRRVNRGESITVIGAALGRSPAAIYDKIRRMGLERPILKLQRRPERTAQPRVRTLMPRAEPYQPAPAVPLDPSRPLVPFADRPRYSCSFIPGDAKADPVMCCGQPVVWRKGAKGGEPTSWCAAHARIVFQPVQPRRAPNAPLEFRVWKTEQAA